MRPFILISSSLIICAVRAFMPRGSVVPLPKVMHRGSVVPLPQVMPLSIYPRNIALQSHSKDSTPFNVTFPKKAIAFMKLVRYKNLLPTVFLTTLGGITEGINPHLPELFTSPAFLTAIIDSSLIMSSSMIINDIFDIPIDRINHPERSLVTGEIKIWEAVLGAIGLIGVAQWLNILFLPPSIQQIVPLASLWITIYTPFLKRIPFVKNLACAALVAFSVFFGGISVFEGMSINEQIVTTHQLNVGLFSTALSLVFFGSLYNEVLLDIRDYEGDLENGIYTLPVLFGKRAAWNISNIILYWNIVSSFLVLSYLYNVFVGIGILFLFRPLIYASFSKDEDLSNAFILDTLKKAMNVLFLLFFYLGGMAFIPNVLPVEEHRYDFLPVQDLPVTDFPIYAIPDAIPVDKLLLQGIPIHWKK